MEIELGIGGKGWRVKGAEPTGVRTFSTSVSWALRAGRERDREREERRGEGEEKEERERETMRGSISRPFRVCSPGSAQEPVQCPLAI